MRLNWAVHMHSLCTTYPVFASQFPHELENKKKCDIPQALCMLSENLVNSQFYPCALLALCLSQVDVGPHLHNVDVDAVLPALTHAVQTHATVVHHACCCPSSCCSNMAATDTRLWEEVKLR